MVRTYGPYRSADPSPNYVREYPNGVVHTVTTDSEGLTTSVWDYTNDTHKA